ncbi:isoprenylcysteine carboxyl methyltransferase family protein [Alkalihalobacterium alkalinitrilicum]|uniref:isoprenylcysteine carboxyl methyltransferase family protein n=1 Tax=Alkalihalobacterium alkalinitrilicum TaxID=427920 RepID=UPI000994A1D6|nr:isoprenylcysteine carboxyl methyltransferase family protein [Alkalihalobacterium alkalinitrilicum]
MLFFTTILVVIIQRVIELLIARRNEIWMKKQGAYEVGKEHYKWIVILHTLFFVSFLFEVVYFGLKPAVWWFVPFLMFILAQMGRVWSLTSLGEFWNTKIIVLPGANVVAKGPYQYMRHPNYVIVGLEIITLPLIFQAYGTAVIFTILNAIVLSVRIRQEEEALREVTNYEEQFNGRYRFIPTVEKD